MEFKKKTLIWEDNSEPPKDYIWIKPDGKAYEFDYTDRIWKESKSISAGSGSGSGSNVELLTLNVTENGEYTPDKGKAYNKVNVNVSGSQTELWLDVSFFSYPDDLEELLAFPFIEPPQVGEQVQIKEPDGNVYTYTVIKNELDEVELRRSTTYGALIFTPNQKEKVLYWGSMID